MSSSSNPTSSVPPSVDPLDLDGGVDNIPADRCFPNEVDDAASAPPAALPAGSWLALLGGGQLGLMFCEAAQRLGYKVAALDPDPDAPVKKTADRLLTAPYLDTRALDTLGALAQAATVEFENVPYPALAHLAGFMPVRPAADAIAIAQDRIEEKTFFARHGLPVGAFMLLRNMDARADLLTNVPAHLFPGRLKTTRLGYDGKGQRLVVSADQIADAFHRLGDVPCVLEKQLDLCGEISVLIARDAQGNVALWPAIENSHRNGILDVSVAPARIPERLAQEARDHACRVAENLGYRGVLCIEFFIDRQGRLYLNEMAPRPHNSGHHTIESCVTSQFEQQARIVASLPLGDTTQHTPAAMLNLLGDLWFADGDDVPREPDWAAVIDGQPGVHLHLYGKKEARPGRKMGHITCCAPTLREALDGIDRVRRALGLPPLPSVSPLETLRDSARAAGDGFDGMVR